MWAPVDTSTITMEQKGRQIQGDTSWAERPHGVECIGFSHFFDSFFEFADDEVGATGAAFELASAAAASGSSGAEGAAPREVVESLGGFVVLPGAYVDFIQSLVTEMLTPLSLTPLSRPTGPADKGGEPQAPIGFNATLTLFQRHVDAISTPFQRHFRLCLEAS